MSELIDYIASDEFRHDLGGAAFRIQAEAQGQQGLPFKGSASCRTPSTCAHRGCGSQCQKDQPAKRSEQYSAMAQSVNEMAYPLSRYAPAVGEAVDPIVVNPKELAGSKKPATWSVMPRWIMLLVGRVMSVGAAKYGAFNYRDSSISASIYQDAMERHSQLWFDGEDDDPETGVSHLASVIASCALLLDAQASGKLNDDRHKTGRVRKALDDLEKLLVSLPLPQPKAA